jgi:hypothetical protein
MGAEPPLRVPPPAAGIVWYWVPSKSGHHGIVHLDEDSEPEAIGINQDLRRSERFLKVILLHELTHLRDPRLNCGSRSPGWKAEQVRLSTLGAPLL